MYTIKIENIEKNNGTPYASVSFTRDTGEIETYKELVLVTPEVAEVPEVRDEETGEVITEGVAYAEAVYDYKEKTRPKLEVVHENFSFVTEEELNDRIVRKRDELIAKHQAATAVVKGDYVPTELAPAPVATPEQLAQDAWLENWRTYQQAKKGMDALKDADIEPTEDELARFNALKTWVAENRKPEYSQFI